MKTAPKFKLTDEQRIMLKRLISRGSSAARVQTRARMLLLAGQRDKTHSNEQIAQVLQVCPRTVSRVRQRFIQGGLEAALYDKPRVCRPPVMDGEAEAHLTMLACSSPPQGRSA